MGTSHFGNEKLVTKTTVVVGKDGSAHAESFIETIPVSSKITRVITYNTTSHFR